MTDNAGLVIAAVIERDGLFLICQRPLNKRHGGLWEFPGGKLEPGETLMDAAKRELEEELGLQVEQVAEPRFSVLDPESGYLINFVDVIILGEPSLLEHMALSWLSAEKILELVLAPSDRLFAEHLCDSDR